MPSKKKKYNARFPAGRIKKIMQTDEEVGKVAQAVPVIISRTLELFVESLLTKAMEITSAKNAKTLTPSHMKKCILSEQRFDFLKDLVKSVQDSATGDDDVATNSSGLLTPPVRRGGSYPRALGDNAFVKNENEFKEETIVIEDNVIKEEVEEEEDSIKEEIDEEEPTEVVANCSTLHLRPNFYSETTGEPAVSIHQPPVVGGYPPPYHPHPYQDPNSLNRSPRLVMDEDYDT
ncbi:dr1-associated corepressor [Macrosteles quadrilineatus]|uniref:dr1-associated corepressor n=1 Tax=Macrosteles quadrilineatus TaxID=74068 RepID=UPI0023E23CCA|nr:dr1-associated corepressor [Macrosteles quadrilineatus]